MRYAMLIFALLGVAGAGFLGSKWLSDYEKNKDKLRQYEEMREKVGAEAMDKLNVALGGDPNAMANLKKIVTAAYLLLAGAAVALIVAIVTFLRKIPGTAAGAILILCAAAPAALEPKSLVFSFPLILAGIFAFFVRRTRVVVDRAEPLAGDLAPSAG